MRILNEKVVRGALSPKIALEASREAFIAIHEHRTDIPHRNIVAVGDYGNTLFKPGIVKLPSELILGEKVIHIRNGNALIGKPTVPASISLYDPITGELRGLMGATWLTAMRTAAGSALSCQIIFSNHDELKKRLKMVVFGAGMQAHCHAICINHALNSNINNIAFINRSSERANELITELKNEMQDMDFKMILSSDKEAVNEVLSDADIVCTTTASAAPLFDGNILKSGCHICAVGSYMPLTTELDFMTIQRAKGNIIIDTAEALNCGDLKMPLDQKIISNVDISGTIGSFLSNNDFKRAQNDSSISLFKSVGTAAQDLTTSNAVFKHACENNTGQIIEL